MKEKIFKLLDGFTTPVMRNGERLVYWKIPMKQLSRKLADYLIANGVTIPVRCKDCKSRGDANNCPMCFEEESEYDDGDGYMAVDYITHDHTVDDGYCHKGERNDNG